MSNQSSSLGKNEDVVKSIKGTGWKRPEDAGFHAHFDCFSGAAGDMILAACLDAAQSLYGDDGSMKLLSHVSTCLKLGIPEISNEFEINHKRVWRGIGSIAAIHVNVESIYNHRAAPVPSRETPGDEGAGVVHDHAHEHSHFHEHRHNATHNHSEHSYMEDNIRYHEYRGLDLANVQEDANTQLENRSSPGEAQSQNLDGHSHSHAHGREHCHEHEHGHDHGHSQKSDQQDHTDAHNHTHGHSHTQTKDAHEHTHGHTHEPENSHEHTHGHAHGHENSHEHTHGHAHGHENSHEHTHDHSHGNGSGPIRNLPEIRQMLMNAPKEYIPVWVRDKSIESFTALAHAEAAVHGAPSENAVHFHEVGAIDSIVDMVGSLLALYCLGVETVSCSRLPLGEGAVKTDHGILPVPAPATLFLLKGMPTSPGPPGLTGELVTPTGAALMKTLTTTCGGAENIPAGRPPRFTLRHVGVGAGTKDFKAHPNILRLMLGDNILLDDRNM